MRLLLSLIASVCVSCTLFAADQDPEPGGKKLTDKELAAARKAVDAHLEKVKGSYGTVEQVKDEPIARAMPAFAFYTVRYRQFPIARQTPEGLKPSNVFAVDAKGKVQVLTTLVELQKFLKASLPAANSKAKLEDAARLAVRLGQEFHQDGMYFFKLEDDSTKVVPGKSATAKAVVMKGGNGTYVVDLKFDATGKLTSLEEKAAIRSGPRPICQATKLLDKDPIVRGMAEQALLCMGRDAKEYLDEQRAKASPELKKAIDAMWQKIRDEDR
jgi:hypothetical protein